MASGAVRSSASELRARAARFEREARKPPPSLPTQRIAWAGGKITTNSKQRALCKLLERKATAGEALTAEQARAAAELGIMVAAGSVVSQDAVKLVSMTKQNAMITRVVQQENIQRGNRSVPISTTKQAPLVKTDASQRASPATQIQEESVQKEIRRLQKKIRECTLLEGKMRSGGVVEANQRQKAARKADFEEMLLKAESALRS